MKYLPRIVDKILEDKLEAKGAVLIEGPKWCGKTTTGKQFAKSVISMGRPDMTVQYQDLAKVHPQRLLEGVTPRLIDEWQLAPNLWNAVRYEVDNREDMGQFNLAIYIREIRCFYVLRTHEAAHANAYALELLPRLAG